MGEWSQGTVMGGVVSGYKDHNGLASGVVPSFTTGQSRRFLINITRLKLINKMISFVCITVVRQILLIQLDLDGCKR